MAKPTRMIKKWLNCSITSFVNVSNQVCSGIPRARKSPLDYLKERNPHSFYKKPIIHTEIEDTISSFKMSKSTRPFRAPV